MARAERTDFYQNFKFHVVETRGFLNPAAGFNTCSSPEYSVDAVEYKEGTWDYTRFQPGGPTTNDITMTRGVARRASEFYAWVQAAILGGEYRTDLEIRHFHRGDIKGTDDRASASRVYRLYNAMPTRCKVAADMDATAADISIEELDVKYESFDIEQTGAVGVGDLTA